MTKKIILILTFLITSILYSQKPNIIIFLADDLTYWDIGIYGGQAETPNIDKLAVEGIRFTNAYQCVAVCGPTRANLLTGLYPVKNGAYPQSSFIKDGIKTMAHCMQGLGYRTAYIGKRHFKPLSSFPFEYLDEDKVMDFDKIDNFLSSVNKEPFLLFVGSTEPHYEWNHGDTSKYPAKQLKLPPNWIDTPKTREFYSKYLAETEYQDWEVGQVIEKLFKNNLYDNSLFLYTSEQGASFPYAKWTTYEAGVHTALIVGAPKFIEIGTTSDAFVDYTDILPTLIDVAGGIIPKYLDGVSFKKSLTGEDFEGKDYVFSMQTTRGEPWGSSDHFAVRCVRDKRYTYIINLHPYMIFENHLTRFGDGFFNEWREAAWHNEDPHNRFVNYITRPAFELYDRENDPFEMNNLIDDPKYLGIKSNLDRELRL